MPYGLSILYTLKRLSYVFFFFQHYQVYYMLGVIFGTGIPALKRLPQAPESLSMSLQDRARRQAHAMSGCHIQRWNMSIITILLGSAILEHS